jgi:hypothetical protein
MDDGETREEAYLLSFLASLRTKAPKGLRTRKKSGRVSS